MDKLIKVMEKRVVAPIAPVAPVLPIAPVAPVLPINSGDHDVLTALVVSVHNLDIKLDDKFNNLSIDIKSINDGVGIKIHDHEDRIRKAETSITQIKTYGTVLVIAIGIIETIIFKFVIK